jgi:hypothetical protein
MAILLIESPNAYSGISIAFRLRLYQDRVEQNGGRCHRKVGQTEARFICLIAGI